MENGQKTIFLDTPASEWETAYPIGGGSIGAMLFCRPEEEIIQFNEESIWSGNPHPYVENDFREKFDRVRKIMLDGDIALGNQTAQEILVGYFEDIDAYESAGELLVKTPCAEYSDYRRELLLEDGLCKVSFRSDGIEYSREAFASYPNRLIALRFTSSEKVGYEISYRRENLRKLEYSADKIELEGVTAKGEHGFCGIIQINSDGECAADGSSIRVQNASCLEIFAVFATEYRFGVDHRSVCEKSSRAFGSGYDKLRDIAVKDHAALMNRSHIGFEGDEELEKLPVSARLKRLREDPGASDPSLVALYFEFGKYLLIGSSRPGTLPANLQGVWNGSLTPPWESDYHTNINLQMNYWPAETANLSECALPLFDYMNGCLLEDGKKTARNFYHLDGAVVHHISDIYGFTKPANALLGMWPIGGAWLCYHMWEHYLFTLDTDFLRDTAYGFISECTKFFIGFMEVDESTGYLITGPSASPENRFFLDDKHEKTGWLCLAPTMDIEVISGLLKMYIKCEELLGINDGLKSQAQEALSKMPPLRVGKFGQLMEWEREYEEAEPGHRHISHAFALYPDCSINRDTPELFEAIKITMQRRLSNGGGHTGWSRAWLISLFARLYDGESANAHIRALLCNCTKENLFDIHPPFQIDGNFGGCAGIIETLLQSHNGEITLLPATDSTTASGHFEGLCARGGIEVSAKWKNGKLYYIRLERRYGNPDGEYITLRLPVGNGGGVKKVFLGSTPVEIGL